MTGLFRYSVIRFRPFAETGEFANIGILVTEISSGKTTFRLAGRRFGRVKHFFDEVGYHAYRSANGYIRTELERAIRDLPLLAGKHDDFFYKNLARERESSVIFSAPRVLKSSDEIETVAENLYSRYIGRNFSAPENVEAALTRDIRTTLRERGITHFKAIRLDDEVVPIILPLAYRSDKIYGIKPLAFSQKSPMSVLDHGSNWKVRFDYLLDKGKLQPENILIALEPPDNNDPAFEEAYGTVVDELNQLPFEMVVADRSYIMMDRISQFALKAPIDRRLFTSH